MKVWVITILLLAVTWSHAESMHEYLSTTRQLTRAGEYAEALERHIWFHENVLDHQPSMYGVRLSFALSNWNALADKYPPAMEALLELRDNTEAAVRESGDFEMFHDLYALNRQLDNVQNTIEVFEYLDQEHPARARRVWRIARDTVIDTERYDLAQKYIGDPVRAFARVKSLYDQNVSMYDDPRFGGDHFRAHTEDTFVDGSLRLIRLALAMDDRDSALAIRDLALDVIDDRRLRDAVPPSPEHDE